jgi:hypothetical protein
MYDHPIKRAGLTFNRILYSNTRMVQNAFPSGNEFRYKINFKVKYFDNGKETSRKYCKTEQLDELFPPRK